MPDLDKTIRRKYCHICDLFVVDWDKHVQEEDHRILKGSRSVI